MKIGDRKKIKSTLVYFMQKIFYKILSMVQIAIIIVSSIESTAALEAAFRLLTRDTQSESDGHFVAHAEALTTH